MANKKDHVGLTDLKRTQKMLGDNKDENELQAMMLECNGEDKYGVAQYDQFMSIVDKGLKIVDKPTKIDQML